MRVKLVCCWSSWFLKLNVGKLLVVFAITWGREVKRASMKLKCCCAEGEFYIHKLLVQTYKFRLSLSTSERVMTLIKEHSWFYLSFIEANFSRKQKSNMSFSSIFNFITKFSFITRQLRHTSSKFKYSQETVELSQFMMLAHFLTVDQSFHCYRQSFSLRQKNTLSFGQWKREWIFTLVIAASRTWRLVLLKFLRSLRKRFDWLRSFLSHSCNDHRSDIDLLRLMLMFHQNYNCLLFLLLSQMPGAGFRLAFIICVRIKRGLSHVNYVCQQRK